MKKNEKGITLIALVVTIIVLLILAGVSISMITGENGIVNQASNAKDATEQGKVEELVDLAVTSLIGENEGSTNEITPDMIAEEVNRMENRDDVYAEGSIFPVDIIFPEEGRRVNVNLEKDWDENYSANVTEEDIAPTELFNYEIISNGETDTEKQVKITGIKDEFYIEDTFYSIEYDGMTDTLVIPYRVQGSKVEGGIANEYYAITEVSLVKFNTTDYYDTCWKALPENLENIIYPNTVSKIYAGEKRFQSQGTYNDGNLKKVVLSNKTEKIPDYFFIGCGSLKEVIIPEGIKEIGRYVFDGCQNLEEITFPSTIETISQYAFMAGESDTDENKIKINIKKPENTIIGAPWSAINAEIVWNYKD